MLHRAWLDRAVAVLPEAKQAFFEQFLLLQCTKGGVGPSDDRNARQVEQVRLIRLRIDEDTSTESLVCEPPAERRPQPLKDGLTRMQEDHIGGVLGLEDSETVPTAWLVALQESPEEIQRTW